MMDELGKKGSVVSFTFCPFCGIEIAVVCTVLGTKSILEPL